MPWTHASRSGSLEIAQMARKPSEGTCKPAIPATYAERSRLSWKSLRQSSDDGAEGRREKVTLAIVYIILHRLGSSPRWNWRTVRVCRWCRRSRWCTSRLSGESRRGKRERRQWKSIYNQRLQTFSNLLLSSHNSPLLASFQKLKSTSDESFKPEASPVDDTTNTRMMTKLRHTMKW